jgi:hypothetical protein
MRPDSGGRARNWLEKRQAHQDITPFENQAIAL